MAPLSGGPAALAGSTQFVLTSLPPGDHTITVSYGGDGNYVASGPASAPEKVTCSRSLTGSQPSLTVAAGQQLCLDHVTVTGNVNIQSGAALSLVDSVISGSVSTSGAQAVRLCSTRVSGGVSVAYSTGFVLIGDGCY